LDDVRWSPSARSAGSTAPVWSYDGAGRKESLVGDCNHATGFRQSQTLCGETVVGANESWQQACNIVRLADGW
jgi:hypothetical protein